MGFFLPYTVGISALFGVWQGGIFAWTGVVMLFGVTLILDEVVKNRQVTKPFLHGLIYHPGLAHVALHLAPPFLLLLMTVSLWKIASMNSLIEITGSVLSVGMVFGVMGLNVSHELMHSRKKWHRAVSLMTLSLVNFCWMRTAHIDVHHRWVGTEKDPSTARQNESIFAFCWRHYFQSLGKSIQFELARGGFGSRNRFWLYSGMGLVVAGLVYLLGFSMAVDSEAALSGWKLLSIWILISVVAKTMLGTLDYIQHKGLLRAEKADHQVEVLGAHHSWECDYLVTNLGLFNLGHHAHHHQKASLEFTKLEALPSSPKMPHGYPMMVIKSVLGLW
ncbi:MAG: fatty acid desaturase [Pseudobdellovibrionaceae bacterium]